MPITRSEETPLENAWAVFRLDNGALRVSKVRGKIAQHFISAVTDREFNKEFHVVEGADGTGYWAENSKNFACVVRLDPDTRRKETEVEWLQREIRELMNEWVI